MYVDIVISNVFNLNNHFFLFFSFFFLLLYKFVLTCVAVVGFMYSCVPATAALSRSSAVLHGQPRMAHGR